METSEYQTFTYPVNRWSIIPMSGPYYSYQAPECSGFRSPFEYSGDLKPDMISNGQSLSGFQMVQILNGWFSLDFFLIFTKNCLIYKTVQTKSTIFSGFEWSGPFEIWPSKSPDFECFRILNGRISDPTVLDFFSSGIQMVVWIMNNSTIRLKLMSWMPD